MSTKTKNTKALKAVQRGHLYMHRTRGGNVVSVQLTVPRVGYISRFDTLWALPPTGEDLSEQQSWLSSVSQVVDVIAGRHLTLRFIDVDGVPVVFPVAEEKEAMK